MPSRPTQHQSEDLSRVKFQLVLPKRWVVRDKSKDYGIDMEVELFDEANNAQGLLFYAQLKSTESKDTSVILKVPLSVDSLKYYKQLDIPVLLVRYSEDEDEFYIKWINSVDLSRLKKNQKSYSIILTQNDKWNQNTVSDIERRLFNLRKLKSGYFNFPIPFSINIKDTTINGVSKNTFMTQLRSKLSIYSDYIKYGTPEGTVIVVELTKNELKINVCDTYGCYFHNIQRRKPKEFLDGIGKDIMLGVAISMLQIGQVEYCARIVFSNNLQSELLSRLEILENVLPSLFQSSFIEKTLLLIEGLLDDPNAITISLITQINLLFASQTENNEKQVMIEQFLFNRLKKSISKKDDLQIGICHYNLGNYYRGRGMHYESIHHYLSAKRFAPIYLKQPYFFKELGGVLFLFGKYKIAAWLYSIAVKHEADALTIALFADALMFSGDYAGARRNFRKYLIETKSSNPEFLLKSICLDRLLKEWKIKKQVRNTQSANLLADVSKIEGKTDPTKQLEEALNLDLLCGLAWFNTGIYSSQKNEREKAAFCFIMAGLVQNNYIEAWKNATLSTFNSADNLFLFSLVVRTAYFFNGEEYVQALYHYLEEHVESSIANSFMEMFERLLPLIKEANVEKPIIRVLNNDGFFVNILDVNKIKRD